MLMPQADLIASSCVAQWFTDLPATLRMWAQSLAPGGLMAFACLLRGLFLRIGKRLLRGAAVPLPRTASCPRRKASRNCCAVPALTPVVCREGFVTAHYRSSRAALRSFQQIGAVLQGQPGHQSLGPAALRRLIACYDRHLDDQGRAPVTHRVQYIIAERAR